MQHIQYGCEKMHFVETLNTTEWQMTLASKMLKPYLKRTQLQ